MDDNGKKKKKAQNNTSCLNTGSKLILTGIFK